MNIPTGWLGVQITHHNLKFLGQGSLKLHGSVQLIFGVGFVPQKLLNQGKLDAFVKTPKTALFEYVTH